MNPVPISREDPVESLTKKLAQLDQEVDEVLEKGDEAIEKANGAVSRLAKAQYDSRSRLCVKASKEDADKNGKGELADADVVEPDDEEDED